MPSLEYVVVPVGESTPAQVGLKLGGGIFVVRVREVGVK